MKKRALIVGINYVGTSNALKGCINDANNMHSFLKDKGFTEIKLVLEKEATTEGIKAGLEWLVAGAQPGDTLVFHYSGHGSQLPSKNEADGFEEIICPIDLNWMDKVITDDTLRQIFNKVSNGVNTTLFLDCCHSGTMLDQTETLDGATRELATPVKKPRKKKGSRFMKPPASVMKKLADRSLVDWSASRDVNQSALLIAGCHATQTSADAFIDGIAQGAATAAMLKSAKSNSSISYRKLVEEMRLYMKAGKFSQVPQLNGSSALYDKVYLNPFALPTVEQPAIEPVVEPAVVTPAPEPAKSENSSKKAIAVIAVVVLILALIFFAG